MKFLWVRAESKEKRLMTDKLFWCYLTWKINKFFYVLYLLAEFWSTNNTLKKEFFLFSCIILLAYDLLSLISCWTCFHWNVHPFYISSIYLTYIKHSNSACIVLDSIQYKSWNCKTNQIKNKVYIDAPPDKIIITNVRIVAGMKGTLWKYLVTVIVILVREAFKVVDGGSGASGSPGRRNSRTTDIYS